MDTFVSPERTISRSHDSPAGLASFGPGAFSPRTASTFLPGFSSFATSVKDFPVIQSACEPTSSPFR